MRRCSSTRHSDVCDWREGWSRALSSVERFDLELGCWERLQDMPDGRMWACAGNIGRTLYVCAGTDGSSTPHSYVRSTHSFQEDLGVWHTHPPMLQGRRGAVSAVLLGCLYVCGGSNGKLPLRSVERFDPHCKALSKWTEVAPMPSGQRHATCFVAGEATLFVLGGEDTSRCTTSSLAFDARVGSWTTLQPQIALGRWWASSAMEAGQPKYLGSVVRFDEEEQRWESVPSLLQARCGAVGGVLACRDLSMW